MDRKKQIEEMHLEFERWDDSDTELSLSEWLYNAGYRKASEIFGEIEKIFGVHLWLNATPQEYEDYEELKKKYIGEDK